MATFNKEYGTGQNKADGIARIGRKTEMMEREIAAAVAKEMQERRAEQERKQQERCFDTTSSENFTAQDLTQNTVGRKVMKTQDGKLVPLECRDEQLMVEQGITRRAQKYTDDELRQRMPAGDYTQQRPVTIYTEALERKNFYMSASTGPNPFAKTSGFTQPANQTKAVQGYEGNIDFAKEKTV